MPFYSCKILNELGAQEKIIREASDEVSLKASLKRESKILLSATKIEEKKPNLFFAVSSKVKKQEVILFLRQFAVMINSSISISDSLGALKTQNYSVAFVNILMEVHEDVQSGLLLSKSFEKHPEVFPRFFTEMVAIGEVSGSLDTVLRSMADYYENTDRVKKKAKSAMVYPILLLVMIVVVVIFLSLVIIPKFQDMFKEYSASLPTITKIIFGFSNFINTNIKYILTIVLALVLIVSIFFQTKKGAYVKDYLKINFPLIGPIQRASIVSKFTKAFTILLRSGMNITTALENLRRVFDNKVFESKFLYSIEEVKRGKKLAKSIENTKMFPTMLTEMIAVGENTGNLEEVLESTTMFFDSQVETAITKSTAAVEPIIIIVLGVVVAIVLLSIYLPMMEIMNYI